MDWSRWMKPGPTHRSNMYNLGSRRTYIAATNQRTPSVHASDSSVHQQAACHFHLLLVENGGQVWSLELKLTKKLQADLLSESSKNNKLNREQKNNKFNIKRGRLFSQPFEWRTKTINNAPGMSKNTKLVLSDIWCSHRVGTIVSLPQKKKRVNSKQLHQE